MRKTWAPRGKTPVLVHRQRSWTRISAAAFVCYRWAGRRARCVYVHLRPGSYNEESLILVLKDLRRHFRGNKVILSVAVHDIPLERRTLHGHFSPDLEPVLTVSSGDTIRLQTLDSGWSVAPPDASGAVTAFEPRRPGLDDGLR